MTEYTGALSGKLGRRSAASASDQVNSAILVPPPSSTIRFITSPNTFPIRDDPHFRMDPTLQPRQIAAQSIDAVTAKILHCLSAFFPVAEHQERREPFQH